MKVLMILLLSFFFALAYSGIVTHHSPGVATSYQNIHIVHFQPVPTYVRKEDLHLLEHPVPVGKSGTRIEVHHEGKHDQGYAIEGHGLEEEHAAHVLEEEHAAHVLEEEHAAHVHEDEAQDQGHDYTADQGDQSEQGHYAQLINQGGYDNENDGSYSVGDSESQHLQTHDETSGADQYQ